MTDRKTLIANVDTICNQIAELKKREERYLVRATNAEQEAKTARELITDCRYKQRRLDDRLQVAIAELQAKDITA